MGPTHHVAVIPDVHMRASLFERARELAREGYEVVFLGDYADNGPRPNDPGLLRELFAFARDAGATCLIGNHDLAYVYPEREAFRISGYEAATARALAQAYAEAADVLQFAARRERYLFSHAGLGTPLLRVLESKYGVSGVDAVVDYLNEWTPDELFYRSPHNDGTDPFDGPCWLRLPQYRGALSAEGITQVVGHSAQAQIRYRYNLLMVDVRLPLLLEW